MSQQEAQAADPGLTHVLPFLTVLYSRKVEVC